MIVHNNVRHKNEHAAPPLPIRYADQVHAHGMRIDSVDAFAIKFDEPNRAIVELISATLRYNQNLIITQDVFHGFKYGTH